MPELTWLGKKKIVTHHLDVPYKTLKRIYSYDERGRHEEDIHSENMIIHGDNLEALRALLPKYEGKIKCIYIDPPYNTGKESWVYNDNVNDPRITKWLGETVGKESEDFTRHDKWLCMMYPRLKLLHSLMAEDGVIFISIKDIELYNLKHVCDEVFGSNNFIDNFIWYINGHTDKQNEITHIHEYILCYAKNKNIVSFNNVVAPHVQEDSKINNTYAQNSISKNGPKNPPSIIELPIGFPCEIEDFIKPPNTRINDCIKEVQVSKYITREMKKKYEFSYPVCLDEMCVHNGKLVKPCKVYSGWMNRELLLKYIDGGCKPIEEDKGTTLHFYLSRNGVVYYKREGRKCKYIQTILENVGTTETNKYMLESMGIEFDYPKPVELIEYLISTISQQDSIILDSFGGSGTTAHAVLNLNHNDGGNRKFILIELSDYADTKTAKRVRSVISGYGTNEKSITGIGGNFSYYELGDTIINSDRFIDL